MKKLFLLFMICVSTFVNAQEKQTDNFKKTDEILSEVVKKALLVAEKTGNFVIEQSPLILQEFYNWHICSSIFWIILSLISIVFAFNFSKIFGKKVDKDYEKKWGQTIIRGYVTDEFFTFIGMAISLVFGFVFLFSNIYKLIFILVAPKLYLIEYFIK